MDVIRNGWHPKGKDGGKESWRGDYKGINQVAGWVGKGKKPGQGTDLQGSSHVSRPLTSLKDPSLFGPPPKNVNYHGGAALPNDITPHTGGIGAPLSQSDLGGNGYGAHQTYQEEEEEEEAGKPAPPPLPYRADRTGLRTDTLPPPPVRRDTVGVEHTNQAPSRPTPNLPPRLPSRQNTASSMTTPTSPPPSYDAAPPTKSSVPSLNQSAMSRLGGAGVSVPSLGIGRTNSGDRDANQSTTVSELGSRFKRLNSNVSSNLTSNNATPSPVQQQQAAPSWAQTQQSLRTAQNFHKDPSSVSLADAQQAASTAQQAHNNAQAFRARHADKIDAAERKATAFNKKYNMTGRLNKFLEDANNEHDQQQQQQQQQQQAQTLPPPPVHPNAVVGSSNTYQRVSPPPPGTSPQPTQTSTVTGRKPPPPPPPKKPSSLQAPPPIPLGTRPTFQ